MRVKGLGKVLDDKGDECKADGETRESVKMTGWKPGEI
jgi:hypothetical protein